MWRKYKRPYQKSNQKYSSRYTDNQFLAKGVEVRYRLLSFFTLMVLLASNGHHLMIEYIDYSLKQMPPGHFKLTHGYLEFIILSVKNIFLIGDAGGFASRLHGGGMSNGMTSGRDVAKYILDPTFKQTEIDRILKKKQDENNLLDKAERLPAWLVTLGIKVSIFFMKSPRLKKFIKFF